MGVHVVLQPGCFHLWLRLVYQYLALFLVPRSVFIIWQNHSLLAREITGQTVSHKIDLFGKYCSVNIAPSHVFLA